jgi:hypothetical protein
LRLRLRLERPGLNGPLAVERPDNRKLLSGGSVAAGAAPGHPDDDQHVIAEVDDFGKLLAVVLPGLPRIGEPLLGPFESPEHASVPHGVELEVGPEPLA